MARLVFVGVDRGSSVEVDAVERAIAAVRAGRDVRCEARANPMFDDATLDAIALATESGIEVEVLPSPAVRALPLFGKRIVVTRARPQAQETLRALRRRGAEPVLVPTIDIGPPDDARAIDDAAARLATYDVVALTSANGVDALFAALARAHLDARAFGGAKVAAIGPGTRVALERRGIRADLEPEEHRGEGLAHAILALAPRSVLIPRAAVAREVLPDTLRAAGVHVDIVEAYRTRVPDVTSFALTADAITFTSSSTADNFVKLFPDAHERLRDVVVASIGPITSDTCRKLGLRVDVEANPYTLPALIEALERAFSAR